MVYCCVRISKDTLLYMHANVSEGIATSTKERACRKLERDLGGLLLNALSDYETVEIMLNPDGRVWQEKLGQGMMCIGELGCAQAESIIKTVAGFHGKEITRGSPVIEGEFPLDSSRFAGQIPPVVSAPCFAIRKKALQVFTLEDYLDNGVLSRAHYELIIKAISKHRNILVIAEPEAVKRHSSTQSFTKWSASFQMNES